MPDPFVHLRVHSAYSLLEGALKIPDLINLCTQHQMPAVGVSDTNNLFGALEFSQSAAKAGVQPIIGICLDVIPHDLEPNQRLQQPDQLLLIAKNETGYENLLKLTSYSYLESPSKEGAMVTYAKLAEHCDGLIALTAGIYGGVGRALLSGRPEQAEKELLWLKEHFESRLYIEIMRHQLPEERQTEAAFLEMAVKHHLPIVATNNAYFATADMYEAHDALLCISGGRYVSEDNRRKLNPEHRFKTAEEMRMLFADLPEAYANTGVIAKRCAVLSPSRDPILPSFHMTDEDGNVLNESEALQKQARDGLQERLEKHVFEEGQSDAEKEEIAKPYRERLEFELDVIITMKFPGYFLIVSDFIKWAKDNEIPVGPGRGSGAGSLVAWSLLITDLDPLRYGLIFERFLNPERVSMPDFDIDFCQDRREEVIRYVQQKYGRDKVAQIITFGKLQARAVLRDVGRVLQMPYGQVDKICKLVPNNPASPVTLEQAIDMEPMLKAKMQEEPEVAHLVKLSLKLEGLYRHASTHAAGVVIADRPLEELIPLYRDPKSDMPVVQFSMKYAEAAGLVKFDFLGLKTLTVLQTAVNMLKERDIEVDLSTLPLDDPETYKMASRGDTIGVFQFESAGMQDALKKLKPDCIEDLIALAALYRPGPMDNIPSYIARKHGKEKPDYLHPSLEPVLKETYGVIIYQEQVQKIAQILSGYTLGAADILRRAMGKKIKEEMDAQRVTFVEGAKEQGNDAKQASEIFDLVAKFAGYGFNKSHAAAYAVVAYHTAYLKANYPVEFLAATMTYDMHNTEKLNVFRQEAQRMGIPFLPPDINASFKNFAVEQTDEGLGIRYALSAIRNVGGAAMQMVIEEREKNGPFLDIFDFANRVDSSVMNRRQIEHLIMAGAFDSMHPNRKQLYDAIELILGLASAASEARNSDQVSLFGGDTGLEVPKPKLPDVQDWPQLDRLHHEFVAIGFYLSDHPLSSYEAILKKLKVTSSLAFETRLGAQYSSLRVAGIVVGRKIKTSPKGRFAFISLSDASGSYEVSVFDEKLLTDKFDMLESGSLILIGADGKRDDGGVRLIAQTIEPLEVASEKHTIAKIVLELEDVKNVAALKEKLGEPVEKGSRLELRVPVGTGIAKLHIPCAYKVTPAEFTEIEALEGVLKAKQA